MSASANKGTNAPGAQKQTEMKVETVDFCSSAGQGQEQIQPVQVVHQPHSPSAGSNTSSSILANAAASVKSTLQSAKDAVSGK